MDLDNLPVIKAKVEKAKPPVPQTADKLPPLTVFKDVHGHVFCTNSVVGLKPILLLSVAGVATMQPANWDADAYDVHRILGKWGGIELEGGEG